MPVCSPGTATPIGRIFVKFYIATFIKTCRANSGTLAMVGKKYGAHVTKNVRVILMNSFWNEESLEYVKKYISLNVFFQKIVPCTR